MEVKGDEIHVETDEARGGSTPNVMRRILFISLAAAIILLSAIWMFGAARQAPEDRSVNVSNTIRDAEGRTGASTDGITIDNVDELTTGDAAPGRIANQPPQPAQPGAAQPGADQTGPAPTDEAPGQ